jgi:hypothetical protein
MPKLQQIETGARKWAGTHHVAVAAILGLIVGFIAHALLF